VTYLLAALVTALCIVVHAWQDRINDCNDGNRYTSGKPQPYPFHHRWCGWPKRVLQVATYASLLALGMLMGGWKGALLLGTLPGFWFISTHPTTVDAPAMLLALGAALLFPSSPWFAVLLACVSGFIHERGPVFAALYAWHPLLLVGLVCVGWWRKPAHADGDQLVGRGLLHAIRAHKPYVDWLDMNVNLYSLRGVWLAMAYYGCSVRALATVGVAMLSRIVGTDSCRYVFWAAPLVVRELPDVPAWAVLVHVVTFRRAI
jgi:hypothetical protein